MYLWRRRLLSHSCSSRMPEPSGSRLTSSSMFLSLPPPPAMSEKEAAWNVTPTPALGSRTLLRVRELDLACLFHSAGTERPQGEGEGEREDDVGQQPPSGVRLCERHARLVEGLEMGDGDGEGEEATSARSSSCWKGRYLAIIFLGNVSFVI